MCRRENPTRSQSPGRLSNTTLLPKINVACEWITSRDPMMTKRDRRISARDQRITERNRRVHGINPMYTARHSIITMRDRTIIEFDPTITAGDREVASRIQRSTNHRSIDVRSLFCNKSRVNGNRKDSSNRGATGKAVCVMTHRMTQGVERSSSRSTRVTVWWRQVFRVEPSPCTAPGSRASTKLLLPREQSPSC